MNEYYYVVIIVLFAFYLKGIMGTGNTTLVVALCSYIIDPKIAVILSSFINIIGGIVMLPVDPVPISKKFWMPIALTMVVGSIMGAIALKNIEPLYFEIILGFVFLFTSTWFLKNNNSNRGNGIVPNSASTGDLFVGLFSGFCGGFVGINAPPLVFYFGRLLNKHYLRRFLVLIFLPAAIAQTSTFISTGLFNIHILLLSTVCLPSIALGIYFGNRSFYKIPEKWFRIALGILLLVASLRMIAKNWTLLLDTAM